MSRLISSHAAVEKIFAALATSARLGAAKGGVIATETEVCLGEVQGLALPNHAALTDARAALTAAREAVDPPARAAHLLVGAIYDELWNGLGRPKADPRLALVFTSAGSTGTNGALGSQPSALRSLAGRLEAGLHPRLPADRCLEAAGEIRVAADALDTALKASAAASEQVSYLSELDRALADIAHTQLAALKAVLKGRGFRSTEIDEVIPPTPLRSKGSAPAPTEPAPTDPEIVPSPS